jgi:hypothetical protein
MLQQGHNYIKKLRFQQVELNKSSICQIDLDPLAQLRNRFSSRGRNLWVWDLFPIGFHVTAHVPANQQTIEVRLFRLLA